MSAQLVDVNAQFAVVRRANNSVFATQNECRSKCSWESERRRKQKQLKRIENVGEQKQQKQLLAQLVDVNAQFADVRRANDSVFAAQNECEWETKLCCEG